MKKNRKVAAIVVMALMMAGCSKGSGIEVVNDPITDVPTITEETPTSTPIVVEDPHGTIKDQVFDLNLDGWGEVRFTTLEPENSNGDVRFQLRKDNQEVYSFPGMRDTNELFSEKFLNVVAVSFQDYNEDGKTDVLTILAYQNTEDNDSAFNSVRIYTQDESGAGFTIDHLLDEYLMKNYYSDSIDSVVTGIKEYKEYEKSMNGPQEVNAQLELIAKNKDVWVDELEYIDFHKFMVSDLDQNGRLEIIVSNLSGTGLYTVTSYYEVNDTYDGLVACPTNMLEEESQADVMDDTTFCYEDDQGVLYYFFTDFMRNGMAEHYDSKQVITLQDSKITVIPLAFRAMIHRSETDYTITCTDANQNEISEAQYDSMEDTVFADLEKHNVTFGWSEMKGVDFSQLSDDELIQRLQESFQGFSIDME